MRSWIAFIALPLTLLSGCSTLTLSKPDELYLATDYAPRPLAASAVEFADAKPVTCDESFGVEVTHGQFPNPRVDFRVLPGMTIVVSQATGRLSGASELPTISRWSWRVPNTANSGCREQQRWSQDDVAIVRGLLYGSQVNVGAGPAPVGTIGDPTAWGVSIQCLTDTKPSGPPSAADPCGTMPATGNDPLVGGLLQPFARGLGFRLRPTQGPISGTGLAQQIASLSSRTLGDMPTTAAEWKKAVNCEDPSNWATAPKSWSDCRSPLAALVFTKAVAEDNGATPIPLAPILRNDLTLLEGADPLFLSAPRPLQSLANPAFDLSGGAPGTGGGTAPPTSAGPQKPLVGEGYQGFVSINVMIPIRIAGKPETMLVPITTTAKTLSGLLGRDVVAVGRLTQWLPRYVHVEKQQTCRFKTPPGGTPRDPIEKCAFIPSESTRVFIRLDPKHGKGSFVVQPEYVLLAPGDLVKLR
jgi:hypothetical protein